MISVNVGLGSSEDLYALRMDPKKVTFHVLFCNTKGHGDTA
jgi:hypothetical protein